MISMDCPKGSSSDTTNLHVHVRLTAKRTTEIEFNESCVVEYSGAPSTSNQRTPLFCSPKAISAIHQLIVIKQSHDYMYFLQCACMLQGVLFYIKMTIPWF